MSTPSSLLSTAARLLCYDKQVQGTLRFLASSRLHALAQRCRRVPRDVQNRQHETHTHRHGLAGGQLRPCVGCRVVAVQLVQPAGRAAAAKDVPGQSLNIKLGLDAPS